MNNYTKTSMMDKFVVILFKLNQKLYAELPSKDKRAYTTKAFAYVFALIVSSVVGLELATTAFNYTGLPAVCATLGYLFIIGHFDLLLIRRAFPRYFRISFSLAIALLSTACALSVISKGDVKKKLSEEYRAKLELLDSNYEATRANRYRALTAIEQEREANHVYLCLPESRILYAGPLFRKKHAFCDSLMNVAQRMKSELDAQEQVYAVAYQNERAKLLEAIQAPTTAGIFDAVRQSYDIIKSDWAKLLVGILTFIIILTLELALVCIKIDNDTMDEFEAKEAELRKQLVRRRIEDDFKLQMEEERHMTEGRLRMLESEAQRRYSMEKVKAEIDGLFLLQHIQGKCELLKREVALSPNIATAFDNLIAKAMDNLGTKLQFEPKIKEEAKLKATAIGTEALGNAEVLKAYYQNTLFFVSEPMRELSEELWQKAGHAKAYAKALFDWAVEHITYNREHNRSYATAREVFNTRLGVCGEMAVFVIAMLRHKKLDASYAHVSVDANGNEVNHACAILKLEGETTLIDVAYKSFDIEHKTFEIKTDKELSQLYVGWNK